jgi:peptidoglycan/xylan/chitin deacetylase (PgdA/CDA1 family)
MKSVMYHYIRDYNKNYPYFNYLSRENFISQIKKFNKKGIINDIEDIKNCRKKFVLTFDDGLKDHIFAAEELSKIGCKGIFFISTYPLQSNKILDVHKAHLILGKFGGKLPLRKLKDHLKRKNLKNFINLKESNKFLSPYKHQKDEKEKKEFKKIINYCGDLKLRSDILDFLLNFFKIKVSVKDFYLTKDEINYISNLGMIIGSHSEKHNLLSRLTIKEQNKEIKNSKKFIESITNKKCNFFCFPYGGKNSYNKHTLRLLRENKYDFSFSVKNSNITKREIEKFKFELPRFDCNKF